jgi:hypothetical protein
MLSASEPYSMNVTLELEQKQLQKRMRARGAVAVMPPHALRMILLGPGGTTALDLWVCGEEFRFAVPAIDLERRGDANTPRSELRGLPVDFLRWWFLRPLGGQLLSFFEQPGGSRRFVLRDDAHVVDLRLGAGPDHALSVRRATLHEEEGVTATRSRCGEVTYFQRSTGIDIDVHCEKLNTTVPPARAFADPDDPQRMCESFPRHAP